MNKIMKSKSMAFITAIMLILSMLYMPGTFHAEAASATVSVTDSGSWSDGTNTYNMFNCTITNNTGSNLTNWKVTIPFSSGASISQDWCGTFSMTNGTLAITACESNQIIAAGSNTSLGFIVMNAGSYDLSKAVLTYDGSSSTVTPTPDIQTSRKPSTQVTPNSSVTPSTAVSAKPSSSPVVSTEPAASPLTTSSASGSAAAVSASTSFTSVKAGTVDLTSIPTINYKTKDLTSSYNSAEKISFTSNAVSYNGSNAIINGSTITITAGGSYVVSGTCSDGQIIVDTTEFVQLILNGVNLTSKTSAPIYVKSADKTVITLADGSSNTLSDTSSMQYTDATEKEPNATIFSKDDLSFNGTGSLTVNANFSNAIQCKDKLKFTQGTYTITSVGDGIQGKDCVGICGGTFNIKTAGDGIKATNDKDAAAGFVEITEGNITINATKDGIQAESYIDIQGGTLNITTNGGSTNGRQHSDGFGMGGFPGWGQPAATTTETTTESCKGLKSNTATIIAGGNNTLNTADDAVNSSNVIYVDGGTTTMAAGDDGLHADTNITVDRGTINMTASYEGYESASIYINGGDNNITASDDGINGSGSGAYVEINGGNLIMDASGDGLDSNGSIVMTGGTALVSGPVESFNGAIDYDKSFNISGGILVATGSSGMAMNVSSTSTQPGLLVNYSSTQAAKTALILRDSNGKDIVAFNPAKGYQSVCISAPGMAVGATYNLYTGSTSSNKMKSLSASEYTLGSLVQSVTLTSIATGGGQGGFPGGGWPGGGMPSSRPGRG